MASTTNYNWSTPDDTALVKDGASAIRTLGSSIDTTTKALNPSTTLGDIEYRSSTANTNTRLPIGTNGQYLTVSGGVPAWATLSAGGMTQLATGSLSGGTVSLTSISGSYKHLQLVLTGVSSSSNFNVGIQYNSLTTNTYSTGSVYVDTTSGAALTNDAGTSRWYPVTNTSSLAASTNYNAVVNFWNYAISGSMRQFSANAAIERTDGLERAFYSWGYEEGTGAITSISILASAGTFDAGTYTLYGVS